MAQMHACVGFSRQGLPGLLLGVHATQGMKVGLPGYSSVKIA